MNIEDAFSQDRCARAEFGDMPGENLKEAEPSDFY